VEIGNAGEVDDLGSSNKDEMGGREIVGEDMDVFDDLNNKHVNQLTCQ
jgi:hypothetical protein